MFHRCTMSSCDHAGKPHGYFVVSLPGVLFDRKERVSFPAGLVFSKFQGGEFYRACVMKGVLDPDLGEAVRDQVLFSDLPEFSEDDDEFMSILFEPYTQESFALHFLRVYIMHIADEDTVSITYRGVKIFSSKQDRKE